MSEVRHDSTAQRFVLRVGNEVAVLRYSLIDSPPTTGAADGRGDQMVSFDSVFVPPALRGRGVASQIASSAFAHAREAGWRVKPTCSYLSENWVPRHPDIHDLVV